MFQFAFKFIKNKLKARTRFCVDDIFSHFQFIFYLKFMHKQVYFKIKCACCLYVFKTALTFRLIFFHFTQFLFILLANHDKRYVQGVHILSCIFYNTSGHTAQSIVLFIIASHTASEFLIIYQLCLSRST